MHWQQFQEELCKSIDSYEIYECHEIDAKWQIRIEQGMSRAWRLNCGHACASRRVDEAVSGGMPPAGEGVFGIC